jgi:hypothetical protein
MTSPPLPYPNIPSNATCSKAIARKRLLHVGTSAVRLRRHRHTIDALSAGVVLAGVLADSGRTGVRSDRSLTGTVALSVAGGVVGAQTLLLGTGAAAGIGVSGIVVINGGWRVGLLTESW